MRPYIYHIHILLNIRNIHSSHNPLIICRYPVAARGFLPPGANVRGAAPPTGNIHPYNNAHINVHNDCSHGTAQCDDSYQLRCLVETIKTYTFYLRHATVFVPQTLHLQMVNGGTNFASFIGCGWNVANVCGWNVTTFHPQTLFLQRVNGGSSFASLIGCWWILAMFAGGML